ncbi:hypothetical protein Tco_1101148 [Tanacetum coccineum]
MEKPKLSRRRSWNIRKRPRDVPVFNKAYGEGGDDIDNARRTLLSYLKPKQNVGIIGAIPLGELQSKVERGSLQTKNLKHQTCQVCILNTDEACPELTLTDKMDLVDRVFKQKEIRAYFELLIFICVGQSEEARLSNEVEANQKMIKKDLEKQHVLRRKVDNLINQNHLFKRSIILIKAWCYYESRILEDDLETKGDVAGKCINGKLTLTVLINSAYGLTNDGIHFRGYSVIGYQNRLHASGGCLYEPEDVEITAYPWDPRVKGLFFTKPRLALQLLERDLSRQKWLKGHEALISLSLKP